MHTEKGKMGGGDEGKCDTKRETLGMGMGFTPRQESSTNVKYMCLAPICAKIGEEGVGWGGEGGSR